MMPRCTSAVPPMIVAAREYHHSARAVFSACAAATGSGDHLLPADLEDQVVHLLFGAAEQEFVDAAVRADRFACGQPPDGRGGPGLRGYHVDVDPGEALALRVGGAGDHHVLPQPAQLGEHLVQHGVAVHAALVLHEVHRRPPSRRRRRR